MPERAITPASQRRERTPWWVVALRILVVLVIAVPVPYVAAAFFAPAPTASATVQPPVIDTGEAPVIGLPEHAISAAWGVVGMPDAAGAAGEDDAHPTASVGKLITVMIVLEAHPIEGDGPGADITIDADDVAFMYTALGQKAPIAPVHEGMVVTERDLIQWALVDSAANAAWTLARWGFGSIDGYLAAAADFAARHGLDRTHMADPVGLDSDTRSSAANIRDVALMAVQTPVVLHAMQLDHVDIPGIGYAPNTNRLLGQHDIDAGKTGTLVVWGRNLFVSAVRLIDGVETRIVGVIMGTISAEDTDTAMLEVLDGVWSGLSTRVLVPAGTVVGTYETAWGAAAQAVTTEDAAALVWSGSSPTADIALEPADADGIGGEAGTMTITAGAQQLEIPVELDGVIHPPDLGWRLAHPGYVIAQVQTLLHR